MSCLGLKGLGTCDWVLGRGDRVGVSGFRCLGF